ncbi:protein kinase [bacterium]|nr:protein kinase [bacterium]
MIGQTILHYRILDKLGEGGMGVVYKAEDTKLERTVALKFLSLTSIGNEEKKRFKREAKAAASLNHPNIATVFAIDEADGQFFIAMEFIEGQSLEDIVGTNGGSPMKIDRAIDYATQIAAGLQAAHEKGIVHRDIKSANIMITDKGVVKIMDFGLAKLANRSKMTQLGTTLGTAAYMSPEQARGEEADNRSDIWSLGVVLYEMISGQLPFKGDYEQAVIYSIINEEPEPLTALRSGVPLALDGIIAKALAKDPSTRYQNVEELPADLTAINTEVVTRSRITPAIGRTESSSRAKIRLLPWILLGVVSLAFVIVVFKEPSNTGVSHTLRTSILPPPGTEFSNLSNAGGQIALSPDGTQLAFVANDSLWVRKLNESTATRLAERARHPFWSPDGNFIGFFSDNKLKKIAASGGPAIALCEAGRNGGTWSKDDVILFSMGTDAGLYRVAATGGTPVEVIKPDTASGEVGLRYPHFLPDGQHFLYLSQASRWFTSKEDAIWVAALETSPSGQDTQLRKRKRLVAASSDMAFANGYLFYIQQNTLMAHPFDPESLEFHGPPAALAGNVHFRAWRGRGVFSVQNDLVIYQTLTDRTGKLVMLNRSGQLLETLSEADPYLDRARLSNDDSKLLITTEKSGNRDVWIYDIGRGIRRRLTVHPAGDGAPQWSPDNQRVVFTSTRGAGSWNLHQKKASGVGDAELLLSSGDINLPTDWSRDGKFIAYRNWSGGDIWILPVANPGNAFPLLKTPFQEHRARFSPNMRWIAFISDESGTEEIYVRPFTREDAPKWQISSNGGVHAEWRGDGKELFYQSLDNKLMAAKLAVVEDKIDVRELRTLFELPEEYGNFQDVTADGQRFVVEGPVLGQINVPLTLVLNWAEELKNK